MTKDNTNSQGLILRMYPTIKHTLTKTWSTELLLRSESRSESVSNGRWALEMIWCCDGSWCSCFIHFILTGARGLTAVYLLLQPGHLEMFPTTKCSLNGCCSVAGVVILKRETIMLQSPPAAIGLLTFVTVGWNAIRGGGDIMVAVKTVADVE